MKTHSWGFFLISSPDNIFVKRFKRFWIMLRNKINSSTIIMNLHACMHACMHASGVFTLINWIMNRAKNNVHLLYLRLLLFSTPNFYNNEEGRVCKASDKMQINKYKHALITKYIYIYVEMYTYIYLHM